MTIYWTHTGLRITYDGKMLVVEDLNPEVKIQNRMFNSEIFWIGLKLVWASIWTWRP